VQYFEEYHPPVDGFDIREMLEYDREEQLRNAGEHVVRRGSS
jgi:hypothetical protein